MSRITELYERLQGKSDMDVFAEKLRLAWHRETSDPVHVHDGWKPDRPERGQSAITSLFVQERFGGEILATMHEGRRHFFNRLPDGTILDFIRPPSPDGRGWNDGVSTAPLDVVQAELEVQARLELLRDNFDDIERMLRNHAESLSRKTPT